MKKTFYLEKLCNLVESLSAHWRYRTLCAI